MLVLLVHSGFVKEKTTQTAAKGYAIPCYKHYKTG